MFRYRRMSKRSTFTIILLLSLALESAADEAPRVHPWLTGKYTLEIGVFLPERTAKLIAGGSIDFNPTPDEFFDVGSQVTVSQSDSTFAAEFGWRWGPRWSMRMQYFDSAGSNTAVLEEDIVWEDLTFLAGTQATVGTSFELTRFVWDYTLDKSPVFDFGISAGFHWLHIRGFADGTVETPSGPSYGRETASVDAPLPNIGFVYAHSLSEKWAYRARLDWFSAKIDPYDGIFINASFGVNYQFSERVGLGVNYNYVELDVGVDGDNWRGEIETSYDGIYAYLGITW
jgi:hypothetical protein